MKSILTPGTVLFGFTIFWGLFAWIDWHFGSVPIALEQQGIAFLPHLILFFLVSAVLGMTIPFLPLGIRWQWRLLAAAIPGSYALNFWFR
jgi:hypothetical protein